MILALQLSKKVIKGTVDDYNFRLLSNFVSTYPNIQVVFIVNDADSFSVATQFSGQAVLLPIPRIPIFGKFIYQRKLNKLLNKMKVDFFMSEGNILAKKIKTRNVVSITHEECLLNKHILKNISAAKLVLVPNKYLKDCLTKIGGSIAQNGFHLPYQYPAISKIISPVEKKNIQKLLSDEREFILLFQNDVSVNQIVTAMKGFTIFKNWQKSNFQILLICKNASKVSLQNLLSTYKFKEDVKLFAEDDFQSDWMLAAFAALVLSKKDETIGIMHRAIAAHTPLLVPDWPSLKSSYGTAVAYFSMDEKAIANQLILLYKDEDYRNNIIEESKKICSKQSSSSVVNLFDLLLK